MLLPAIYSHFDFSLIDSLGETKGNFLIDWLKNDDNRTEMLAVARRFASSSQWMKRRIIPSKARLSLQLALYSTFLVTALTRSSMSLVQSPAGQFQKNGLCHRWPRRRFETDQGTNPRHTNSFRRGISRNAINKIDWVSDRGPVVFSIKYAASSRRSTFLSTHFDVCESTS